jgi:hypothetical protein
MKSRFTTTILRHCGTPLVALGIAMMASTTAHASSIFSSDLGLGFTTPSGCNACGGANYAYQLGYEGGAAAGITSNTLPSPPANPATWGYNFLYSGTTYAINTGAYNQGNQGNFKLDSATTADPLDSQDGGFFLALDSIYDTAPIDISLATQVGVTYTVTFDWAATQAAGVVSPVTTTDQLTVDLTGDASQETSALSVQPQSFTGCPTGPQPTAWCAVTDTFVATTTTSTLSFLASGTPASNGLQPAIALLDNINVSTTVTPPTSTPEPSSLMLLSSGLLALAGFARWRLKRSAVTNL